MEINAQPICITNSKMREDREKNERFQIIREEITFETTKEGSKKKTPNKHSKKQFHQYTKKKLESAPITSTNSSKETKNFK